MNSLLKGSLKPIVAACALVAAAATASIVLPDVADAAVTWQNVDTAGTGVQTSFKGWGTTILVMIVIAAGAITSTKFLGPGIAIIALGVIGGVLLAAA